MSLELIVSLVGAGGSALLVLLGQAVAWGRIRQTLEHLQETSKETIDLVRDMQRGQVSESQRTTALETTAEDHGERLDRLEAPLFAKRH